ncbi:hypothetical protein ABKV19_008487 [Rosa sericea]
MITDHVSGTPLVVFSPRWLATPNGILRRNKAARVFESQLAESILEGDGQLAFQKLATTTFEKLMPRIEGKRGFGQARWRLVYAPQIPSLLSVDPTVDPLKSLASNISFGTEVEVQLGKTSSGFHAPRLLVQVTCAHS